MKKLTLFALTLALGLGSSAVLVAQDAPASGAKPAMTSKTRGLVVPYSKMTTLTADQKEKIIAIHKAVKDEEAKLEDKEKADILALLSADQKTELEKVNDETKASRKKSPATKPAGDGM